MRFSTNGLQATLGCALLLMPAQADAQNWETSEKSLEGRELVMRPTVEGRRKVYLDDASG